MPTLHCDRRCQEAKGDICDCPCMGQFHGVAHRPGGLEAALRTADKKTVKALGMKARQLDLPMGAKE